MLVAEAEILALDLDCFRLLQGYRESCLGARSARAKVSAKQAAAAKAKAEAEAEAEAEIGSETSEQAEPSEPVEPQPQEAEVAGEGDVPMPQKPAQPEIEVGDPWVGRICELDEVEPDRLSELHGKLIAAGFINFQIRNRTFGVEYRMSNAGKQYLTKKLNQASELAAEGSERTEDNSDDALEDDFED